MLLGLFGVKNLGNDATLDVTLQHLRRRIPSPSILCVCANPLKVERAYGVSSAPFDPLPPWSFWRIGNRLLRNALVVTALLVTEPFRRRRVARQLRGARHLLVVGTGILDDFGESFWRMPLWLWRWCDVARKNGVPVEFVGIGAGPINDRANRLLMMKAIRVAARRTFRDRVSRDYMANLGLDTAQDGIVPDLVFGLSPERLSSAPPRDPPRSVGVGLMGYYGWSNDRARGKTVYDEYIARMGSFVSWLLRNDYEVRLLIGQEGADDQAVKDLRRTLSADGVPTGHLVSRPLDSFDALLGEIAQTDLVIASRFHNVIGALMLARPVISIGYAQKFDALMHEMGLGAYCQHIEHLDVDKLKAQFRAQTSAHSRIVATIRRECDNYRALVERVYDSLWS